MAREGLLNKKKRSSGPIVFTSNIFGASKKNSADLSMQNNNLSENIMGSTFQINEEPLEKSDSESSDEIINDKVIESAQSNETYGISPKNGYDLGKQPTFNKIKSEKVRNKTGRFNDGFDTFGP